MAGSSAGWPPEQFPCTIPQGSGWACTPHADTHTHTATVAPLQYSSQLDKTHRPLARMGQIPLRWCESDVTPLKSMGQIHHCPRPPLCQLGQHTVAALQAKVPPWEYPRAGFSRRSDPACMCSPAELAESSYVTTDRRHHQPVNKTSPAKF